MSVRVCGALQDDERENKGRVRGWKMSEWGMMKVTGDKKQSAAKRAQQGYEKAEMCVRVYVCVCTCTWMILWCVDTLIVPSPPLCSVQPQHTHTPVGVLLPLHSPLAPHPSTHFLSSSPIPHSTSPYTLFSHCPFSGSTLVQSLVVSLAARFPSGHSIKSWLLTLIQPDWARANLVSFSFPPPPPVHTKRALSNQDIHKTII